MVLLNYIQPSFFRMFSYLGEWGSAYMSRHDRIPVCHGKNPCLYTTFEIDPKNMDAILGPCWNCWIQSQTHECQIKGARVEFCFPGANGWSGTVTLSKITRSGGGGGDDDDGTAGVSFFAPKNDMRVGWIAADTFEET
jgi:hypothetical protein